MATFSSPPAIVPPSASNPTAKLSFSVSGISRAPYPKAIFLVPEVFPESAPLPIAEL